MGGICRSPHKVSCKLSSKVVMPFASFKIIQNKNKILDAGGKMHLLGILEVWATISCKILYCYSVRLAGVFFPVAIGKVE